MNILLIILIVYGVFSIAQILYLKKLEKKFHEKNKKEENYKASYQFNIMNKA